MPDNMVERVARAIWDDACPGMMWGAEDELTYSGWARAAIEAMREPTPEMLRAEGVHTNCHMCGGHKEGWQTMIDAALSYRSITEGTENPIK